jgi:hypothetical protein
MSNTLGSAAVKFVGSHETIETKTLSNYSFRYIVRAVDANRLVFRSLSRRQLQLGVVNESN